MSWLFSQALVAEFSEENCSDGVPYAQLNLMDTPHKFSHNGRMMDASNHSRYGLTCKALMERRGEELLTWYREVFLARISAAQEKEQDFQENVPDCGSRCPELLERYNQNSASLKIARYSDQEDYVSFFKTLPRWGSMRNGVLLEHIMSEHLTKETVCGSWLPTPSGCRSGKNHVAGRLDEWGGSTNPWRGTPTGKMHCPDFEEWVMGWPERWTELTPSGTDKFRQWLQQHGQF